VDASRNILWVEYQDQKAGGSMLNMGSTAARDISPGKRTSSREKKTVASKAMRKQQALKENVDASSYIASDMPMPKRKGPGKKQEVPAVKHRDPASEKTWSGRGRKLSRMRGDADQ
jgi:DNA-binding protein H-NS